MDKNKNVLVLGLGTTGLSTIEALNHKGYNLYVYDDKEDNYTKCPENVKWYQGQELDFVVKSPGIPLNNPMVMSLIDKYSIISDVELAYKLTRSKNIIAVTGTNGKTTITKLFQAVMDRAGKKSLMGGNIGIGVLPQALKAEEEDILLIECSSFQLETSEEFKPKVAIISNITEDHIDHHESLENYRKSKKKIFANQGAGDFLILNIDDPYLALVGEEHEEAYVVSLHPIQQRGAYEAEGQLWYNLDGTPKFFMNRSEIQVVGDHNVRNFLEVLLASLLMGVEEDVIRDTYREFPGVEHRIEFVTERNGVKIYNDSKGTNPDSTEVAVKSMPGPVHLLAGGFNKGSDFGPLFESVGEHIKKLYVFGETAEILGEAAEKAGVKDISYFKNMEDATMESLKEAESTETILLSPACASWDAFKNYEIRGSRFKELILNSGS